MKFDKELKKIGGVSRWLMMILLFVSLPSLCNVMLNAVLTKISSLDFKTRCRIPQLENKNWSFQQIQYISAPSDKTIWNCTYLRYNYSVLAKMEYNDVVTYVERYIDPEISFCTEFIHEGGTKYSVYEEFSLVCKRAGLVEALDISPVYGQVVASLLILPLADLLGRKRMIKLGANLFIGGAVMMSLANTAEILVFSRFLVGMAYTLMIHPMEALMVEISNIQLRPFYFVMMHISIGFGYIITALIATQIWHWRLLQWTACSSLLLLPLSTWYVPESPRWFKSKGKKAKAWGILKTIKDPVAQYDLLLSYKNEKRNYWEEIKAHFIECKPFLPKLMLLITLSFSANVVFFKNFLIRFQMAFYESRSDYFILSGIEEIVSYVLCLPLLLFFGRITMGLFFICSGISYLFAAQLETGTTKSLILILTTELMTSTVYITSLLYINEIVPTSHRCTLTGMVYGFGGGLATIIMFHTYNNFIAEEHLFTFLSCVCLVGVPIALFTDETQDKDICDTIEEAIQAHEN